MSRHNRDRKKKHRQKQPEERADLARGLAALAELARASPFGMPADWPGAADKHLARPDLLKAEIGELLYMRPPGTARLKVLEDRLQRGPLGNWPGLHDWALEEALWHGLPGDPWHPIDAFLEALGSALSPLARQQVLLWKQARIGLFLISTVAGGVVMLQEFDPVSESSIGPPLRAISLNIGGAEVYSRSTGHILLTYVAPWGEEAGRICALGYGSCARREEIAFLIPYLGLRHPEIVTRPLPWKMNREAGEAALREWKAREWHGWLAERLQFPFRALVATPPDARPELRQVVGLIPSTPEQARQIGIYFEVPPGGRRWVETALAAGGTMLTPVDVTGPNLVPMLEYHAFRERVGPPPGVPRDTTFLGL